MAAATPERLNGVPGIGAATAPRLIDAAKAVVSSEHPSLEEERGPSGKSKLAAEPADFVKKKGTKPKTADKKSGKKSKKKVKMKSKGKPTEKRDKKKPKKAKARKKA